MPDEEKLLIARFLRANDYSQTLSSFLAEAGLPEDFGSTAAKDDLTLEKLLQEKRAYDLAANFEKLGTDETVAWRVPAPSDPAQVKLPNPANILALGVQSERFENGRAQSRLLSSGADRRLTTVNCGALGSPENLSNQEAPVLSILALMDLLVIGDMAGNVQLLSKVGDIVLDRRKDHNKYVVKLSAHQRKEGIWIASAGWDARVYLYWIPASNTPPTLGRPRARIDLVTNPEAMVFASDPDSGLLNLIVSRRDSTFLYFYSVPDSLEPSDAKEPSPLVLLGRQNLAPHALSWIAYTPSAIAICPTDATKVAVATSSMPHMKILVVRLLFPVDPDTGMSDGRPAVPSSTSDSHVGASNISGTLGQESNAASAAREQLALQNREEAAIIISCNTMAPQTQYSTPVVVWRPDGSGMFINGDDGIIRGIEATSGKVLCHLDGHEPGSKVRCLWAGNVEIDDADVATRKEWLISGGFDQRLIVWR